MEDSGSGTCGPLGGGDGDGCPRLATVMSKKECAHIKEIIGFLATHDMKLADLLELRYYNNRMNAELSKQAGQILDDMLKVKVKGAAKKTK